MKDAKNHPYKQVGGKLNRHSPKILIIEIMTNKYILLIGLVIIFLGFYLMAGKDDIFSTTKLIVAPVVVLSGFVIELFAIMKSPKEKNTEV